MCGLRQSSSPGSPPKNQAVTSPLPCLAAREMTVSLLGPAHAFAGADAATPAAPVAAPLIRVRREKRSSNIVVLPHAHTPPRSLARCAGAAPAPEITLARTARLAGLGPSIEPA